MKVVKDFEFLLNPDTTLRYEWFRKVVESFCFCKLVLVPLATFNILVLYNIGKDSQD